MRCSSAWALRLLLQTRKMSNAIRNVPTTAAPAPIPALAPGESPFSGLGNDVGLRDGESEVADAAACVMAFEVGRALDAGVAVLVRGVERGVVLVV